MNRIKILREENNLTQKELSQKINVAESSISLYEKEERTPSYEVIKKLADLFDVSIDYLMGRTDKRKYNLVTMEDDNLVLDINVNEIPPLSPEKKKWLENVVLTLLKGDDK